MQARLVVTVIAILFGTSSAVLAQTPKTAAAVFQLGNQATRIPAPEGFEEAASQFDVIKAQFTQAEAPENDMLAVHLPHADCERLRKGEFGSFNFNTKVSIHGQFATSPIRPAFRNLFAEFQKSRFKCRR